MNKIEIPISERARKYGYVFWHAKNDEVVNSFFKNADVIAVVFDGAKLGEKKIDFKLRRFSVGWRWTRQLPKSVKNFVLTRTGDQINIICR